jgi:uncharacterized membrane protein YhaH (DUF805 family)
MRRALYWVGAVLLIIALIVLIFGAANFIAERHWPFYKIWGGFLFLLFALVFLLSAEEGLFSAG